MNPGYNNNFNIDYPCPGFCSKCFIEVAEFRGSYEASPGIFLPLVVALKPNFRVQRVYLSDGSQMDITLCDKCFDLTPLDLPQLMTNEVKGWQKEVENHGLRDKLDASQLEKMGVKQSSLAIIDVPALKWDSAVIADIQKAIDAVKTPPPIQPTEEPVMEK